MLQFDFNFLLKPKCIAEASRKCTLISSKLQTLHPCRRGAPFTSAQERHQSIPEWKGQAAFCAVMLNMERNYIKSHRQGRCLYLLCPTIRSLGKCRIFLLKTEMDCVSPFYGKSPTALLTAFICLQPSSQVLLFPLNKTLIWNYISIGTPENFPQDRKMVLYWFEV